MTQVSLPTQTYEEPNVKSDKGGTSPGQSHTYLKVGDVGERSGQGAALLNWRGHPWSKETATTWLQPCRTASHATRSKGSQEARICENS